MGILTVKMERSRELRFEHIEHRMTRLEQNVVVPEGKVMFEDGSIGNPYPDEIKDRQSSVGVL